MSSSLEGRVFSAMVGILTLLSSAVMAGATADTVAVLRVGVELSDGSYILGHPTISNIAVRTSYAVLNVNLEHVSGVTVSPGDGVASVTLRNGDRIKGVLEAEEVRIESLVGSVAVRRDQMVTLRVFRKGTMDAETAKGLLLHYTFDTGDRLAEDSGPSKRHGAVHGAKYEEKGKRNGAADFDGRTAHIRTPAVDNTGDATWALWVSPRSLVGTDKVVQPIGLQRDAWVWNSCNTSLHFIRGTADSGWVHFYVQGPTNSVRFQAAFGEIIGNWVHLVCTIGADGWSLYKDGRLVARLPETTRIGSPCSMIIGANDDGPQRYFDGLIDEVMVFGRALSAEEVGQLYESQK